MPNHDCLHEGEIGAFNNFMERGENFMEKHAGTLEYIGSLKDREKQNRGLLYTVLGGVIISIIIQFIQNYAIVKEIAKFIKTP